MKNRIIIFLVFFPMVIEAQIGRDVKSWLADIDIGQSNEKPSISTHQYESLNDFLQPSKPLLSLSEKYMPIFNYEQLLIKRSYKLLKPINSSIWEPSNKLSFERKSIEYQNLPFSPQNLSVIDLRANYKITNTLSLNGYGSYMANDYKNPTIMQSTLYRSEIGTNLSYSITKSLKIKAGMQYQYNTATRRWEYMFCTGIALDF